MRKLTWTTVTFAVVLPLMSAARAQGQSQGRLRYPEARRVDVIDVYHGVEVADPYRWMEKLDSEEVRTWMAAEDELLGSFFGDDPLVARIRDRLETLREVDRRGMPTEKGRFTFYSYTRAGQIAGVVYAQESGHEPRVVLDVESLRASASTVAVNSFSPEGSFLSYVFSEDQGRWRQIHLVRVEDGALLADVLTGITSNGSGIAWTTDEAGFFYVRYPIPDDPQALLGLASIYYHRVGTDQSEDALVYERPQDPTLAYSLRVTDDGRYLILSASVSGTFNGLSERLFYLDLADGNGEVHELFAGLGAMHAFEGNRGERFWIRTTQHAPNARLVEVDLREPSPSAWRELIEEEDDPLQSVSVTGGRFVTLYTVDASTVVRIHGLDGRLEREVDLVAPAVYGNIYADDADNPITHFGVNRLYDRNVYSLDVRSGEVAVQFRADSALNPDDFAFEQVFYTSKDGTRVPMWIVHKKGIKRDGTNPVFMYAYGAWSWSAFPWQAHMVPWMEMGGVYAVPNIRGGGEYGERWHEAGMRRRKQTGVDDFIAAAEWLIDNGYTSPDRMVANGGSASGLLPAVAVQQRPELFGASVINFPSLDQIRFDRFGAAKGWIPEFGDPADPDDFTVLYALSPYHQLEEGRCYPPTWIQVGEEDQTTTPMHGYKYAAALQALQACDNPVLLKIAWGAGHTYGRTLEQTQETQAEELAFLARVLNLRLQEPFSPGGP